MGNAVLSLNVQLFVLLRARASSPGPSLLQVRHGACANLSRGNAGFTLPSELITVNLSARWDTFYH